VDDRKIRVSKGEQALGLGACSLNTDWGSNCYIHCSLEWVLATTDVVAVDIYVDNKRVLY